MSFESCPDFCPSAGGGAAPAWLCHADGTSGCAARTLTGTRCYFTPLSLFTHLSLDITALCCQQATVLTVMSCSPQRRPGCGALAPAASSKPEILANLQRAWSRCSKGTSERAALLRASGAASLAAWLCSELPQDLLEGVTAAS